MYALVQGPTVNFYTPPGVNSLAPTACTCNTVLYSMLSACSVCQLESFLAYVYVTRLYHVTHLSVAGQSGNRAARLFTSHSKRTFV